jgi:phosphatidylinositol N-acetylglucosaminyltransferase subunit Q
MLDSYFQLANRIRKHYVSPAVIGYLASGRFVPPIHRKNLYSLQYSMLPAQRVSISELWRQLTESEPNRMGEANGGLNGYISVKRSVVNVNGIPTLPRRGVGGRG